MAISKIIGSGLGTINSPVEFTSADNLTQLTLTSTDADATTGPVLDLVRDSGSPADGDSIGQIKFTADNDAGEATIYSNINNTLRDASNGAEDGQFQLSVMTNGSSVDYLRIGRAAANGQSEVIINEGSADIDFRVESNGQANMLVVNGGTDSVQINTNADLITGNAVLSVNGQVEVETPSGSQCFDMKRGNAGLLQNFRKASGSSVGNITITDSGTSFNESSDYRLKENVVTDWDATTRLKQLKPSRFNFIIDADTTVDGFLAHEVQAIVPEAVTGAKDAVEVWNSSEELPDGVSAGDNKLDSDGNTIPDMQSIDKGKLVPLLTKALQEQQATIEALTARIVTLEG